MEITLRLTLDFRGLGVWQWNYRSGWIQDSSAPSSRDVSVVSCPFSVDSCCGRLGIVLIWLL